MAIVPGPHIAHVVLPIPLENVPLLHSKHDVIPGCEAYIPCIHWEHAAAPVTFDALPTLHDKHDV